MIDKAGQRLWRQLTAELYVGLNKISEYTNWVGKLLRVDIFITKWIYLIYSYIFHALTGSFVKLNVMRWWWFWDNLQTGNHRITHGLSMDFKYCALRQLWMKTHFENLFKVEVRLQTVLQKIISSSSTEWCDKFFVNWARGVIAKYFS